MPLTFEKFYTVLTQVEAVFNSRPLVPLTSDLKYPEGITPSHFLTGQPLNLLPQEYVEELPISYVWRFHNLQKIAQHFWTQGVKDYLPNL